MRIQSTPVIKQKTSRFGSFVGTRQSKTFTNEPPSPTEAICEFNLNTNDIKNYGGIESKCVLKQFYKIEILIRHLDNGVEGVSELVYYHDEAAYLRDVVPIASAIVKGFKEVEPIESIARMHLLTPEEVTYYMHNSILPQHTPYHQGDWNITYYMNVAA